MRRRAFLLAGLGAGGALALGWSFLPPRQRLIPDAFPELPPGVTPLNGWIAIGTDDRVQVLSPKVEMGQGIHTALALLVAEELDVPWDRVTVTASGIDAIYFNIAAFVDAMPLHADDRDTRLVRLLRWQAAKIAREAGVMTTAGSSSVRDLWEVARLAGATARSALVEAAAARAGVPVSACRAADGVVTVPGGQFRYGELVADAATRTPRDVTLKAPAQFTRVGTALPRVDLHAKSRGTAVYGIDLPLPGLLHAAIAMPPALGCVPLRVDDRAARAAPGVRDVVTVPADERGTRAGVAIIADRWWQAHRALATLGIAWSTSPHATLDSAGISRTLRRAVREDGGFPFRSRGDARGALARAARTIDVTYEAPYLAHAALEPLSATAQVTALQGRVTQVTVWAATQVPAHARAAVAEQHGVPEDAVTVHQVEMGGSFGRRLDIDFILQAVRVAAARPGSPVRLAWSREDDMRHDVYRPAAVARWRAALDAQGQLLGVVGHGVSQAPFKAVSRRVGIVWTSHGPDRYAGEGAWDQPYAFPAVRFTQREVELPVPVGSWRSVGHSLHGFFLESFIDELASAAGVDPLAYRQSLLRAHPRAARVLRTVAEQSGWGTSLVPAADGQPRARGVALHWMVDTIVALVVEVSLSPAGTVRVHRAVSAVDCGLAIHPDGVKQQIEGAIVFGLSAALSGEITIAGGAVRQGNFDTYPVLRMDACPAIEVHVMPSAEVPSGVGEAGVPPVAPAVANALFALTGERLRTLPLRPTRTTAITTTTTTTTDTSSVR
ncbi:MAG: molybdopterin-dependent oxidoreductase [Gemmatimonadetes bacterium]|nr:molybdopterin-dependent oxidoreductase [Gemmatimonadota bacterium]